MNLESSTSVVPILHGEAEAPTRAGAPPETMQVRIPHGVPAGAKLQITGSSGNRLELVVPPNTPPCSLIQVEMPATGVCLYMYTGPVFIFNITYPVSSFSQTT